MVCSILGHSRYSFALQNDADEQIQMVLINTHCEDEMMCIFAVPSILRSSMVVLEIDEFPFGLSTSTPHFDT